MNGIAFRVQRVLLIVGIATTLAHFSDNALRIARYPEPSWITPIGVVSAWFVITPVALLALSRKSSDRAFLMLSAGYSLILMSGLLHYAYASHATMAASVHLTILCEAATGAALAIALFFGLLRYGLEKSV